MNIDWFTLIAQIVNFLILVAVLRYFLYKRVIRAMDNRQEKIAFRLENAEQKEEQAVKKKQEYDEKVAELERTRNEKLKDMEYQAAEKKQELMEQNRKQVRDRRRMWEQGLHRHQEELYRALQETVTEHICTSMHRMVRDIAGQDLERYAVNAFLKHMKELSGEEKKDFVKALSGSNADIEIRTAYALSRHMRQKVRKAIKRFIQDRVNEDFIRDEQVLCGIELIANSKKISWSASAYVAELAQKLKDTFEEYSAGHETSEDDHEDSDETEESVD